MNLMTDFQIILPEIFLGIVAMMLLMIGVFQKKQDDASGSVTWIAIYSLLITAGLVLLTPDYQGLAFFDLFVRDGYANFVKVIILLAACAGIITTMVDFQGAKDWRFEIPVLMVLATLGMMVMVSSNNFMTLYMGLELMSLSLYVLAAVKRDTLRSTEAGLKYFVLGAVSSGFILYGASLFYGFAGTLSFDGIANVFATGDNSMGAMLGLVFVLAGIAFKISAVPFHMWTPDVYEGAPTGITSFFAAAPKFTAIAVLVRLLLDPLSGMISDWQQIIIFISVASMFVGAVAAIAQTNMKRLLAYSSIGHIGYALMALAVNTPNVAAVSSLLAYMVIYLLMSIGTFGVIVCIRQQDRSLEQIEDLAGLSKTQPFMAFIMAVFMFSMAGIPPLAGFLAKFYVFKTVVDAGIIWLAVYGVVTSVIGAYYYIRVVKVMYFDDVNEEYHVAQSSVLHFILTVLAFVMIVMIVSPSYVLAHTEMAAISLLTSY